MATISHALSGIKSQLDRHVPTGLIEDACRHAGHRWRRRTLDPATTVHLFLLQLLARVALSGLRHVAGLRVSAQAVCRAKARLPLAVLQRLVAAVCDGVCGGGDGASSSSSSSSSLWHGLRLKVVDGLSFLTQDTPALAARYGKARNHRGVSAGYPVPKLLAAVDLATGMIQRVIALPWARQERTCLGRLLGHMGVGDLMLGDRGLTGYAQLAMALARGVHVLMRLPKCMRVHGRGSGHHRRLRRLGRQDLLVRWTRPPTCRRPKWISRARWLALPPHLVLRQVAFRVHRPGHRPAWVWVVTTLSVAELYPAPDVAELYGKRWQIEVHFRDVRKTLGLTQLSARTVAGVRKEVLAFVLLYNLARRVMLEAAGRQRVAADRVSFVDALRWLLWAAPAVATTDAGTDASTDATADVWPPTLLVNARRRRPAEPRRLKRGRKRFPQLRAPRHTLRLPVAEVKL